MRNFCRILRISFRQRLAIAGVVLSSAFVALLWGLNIGTLYPMIEIVFEGDGVSSYVEKEQAKLVTEISQIQADLQQLADERGLATTDEERTRIDSVILWNESKLAVENRKSEALAWAAPLAAKYLPNRPFQVLVMLIVVLMVGTAIKLVALTANLMLVQEVSERTCMDVRNMLFRQSLRLDLNSFGDNGSSGLTARLTNDVGNLATGINVLFGRTIREPMKMIVCVAGAAIVCWRLLLLIMVIAPVMGWVISMLSKSIRRASRRVMEEMTQMYSVLTEAFAGIKVVKAYNTQGFERARFARSAQLCYSKSMKASWYHSLTRPATEMLGMAMIALAIIAGGYLVLNQKTHLLGIRMTYTELGFAEVLLFFAFLIGTTDPARKLTDVWSVLQRGIAAADRIYEILDQPIRVVDPAQPVTLQGRHQKIAFNDIKFSYPSGPLTLNGLNLEIHQGENIAIVGPNGSGKSTLINLLCRFYDPQGGSVTIDDVPVSQLRLRDLRRRIGLVTQRTFLFEDTILNNIRYGSPGATEQQVIEAAERAHADEFIMSKMPDGYQTLLGCGSMHLSGGQMQRIALARAILRDPEILILDEATSQIDLESEALIHDVLADFLKDRTGIMITHRPTTLELADRIAIIEQGELSEIGTHHQLIGNNAFYSSLVGNEISKAA
ncbi:Lipid A export ATP-binding/permease protein MsbA [Rosistilla carotiformis]|uniref:Lipid A export ATP-binding/permease protein MsbA n=1 Tax=Rosistilla carotiformis TaxID=2528017 RepID=A0A518JRT8_9BACT|nr:ABC transporter transmembrane domain-containing protein [Rosistilla carotiformis]QDV68263.1 Lipid A export ATP-binding/permease protein MsbA [Rosistilla carotiformis]